MTIHFRTVSLIIALFLPGLTQAAPQSITAESRISAVTVYANQALVTRTSSIELRQGTNLVSLEGLPETMAEDSLRAEGSGPGSTKITGVTVKSVFLERIQEKRIHEIEDEIQAVSRKLESLEARRKGLVAQRSFLDSIKVGWGERISKDLALGKPSTAELGDAARFVGDGVGKLEEALYDIEAARLPLQNRLAALKQQLSDARGSLKKEVRAVEVAVEAERPMQFNLELSYLVQDAHWEPTYDVRLSPDGSSAELSYRAQVWQRSGEAWPGVQLALSSAAPEAGGAPPELQPWRVAFWEAPRPIPYPMAKRATAMQAPPPMTEGMDMAAAPMVGSAPAYEPARQLQAQVEEGQTSVLFKVARPVDIPADGTRAVSLIAQEKVPVSAEFVSVPKLAPRVYLKSEVTNNTSYPLLAGSVNIFNDNIFTGKSYLKTIASGEKFDLYFGADDQVKVKRDVTRVRKQAGILSSNRISYQVRIELQNFKKQTISLSLLDQLPLAGNAEIKVNLENEQPKVTEQRPDSSNTLVWKLSLAPGEKKVVSYDIVIEYPKGRELTGAE
jgi:uncharacterized protein (TIGR02231 family)